jgi:hypothetical protein
MGAHGPNYLMLQYHSSRPEETGRDEIAVLHDRNTAPDAHNIQTTLDVSTAFGLNNLWQDHDALDLKHHHSSTIHPILMHPAVEP